MDSSDSPKDNKLTKREIVLIIVSLVLIISLSVFTVGMSFDYITTVLKAKNNDTSHTAHDFIFTLAAVFASLYWAIPLAIVVELQKSRLKSIRIYRIVALIYSACGLIFCAIVGIFLPRWI